MAHAVPPWLHAGLAHGSLSGWIATAPPTAHHALDSWLAPENRAVVLGILVPASAGLLALVSDLLASIPCPKLLVRPARTLTSPFRNFLTLEDLDDTTERPVLVPTWKARAAAVLSALECAAWTAVFAYALSVDNTPLATQAAVAVLTWVGAVSVRSSGHRH